MFRVCGSLCSLSAKSHVDPAIQVHPISKTKFFGSTCAFSGTKLDRLEKNLDCCGFGEMSRRKFFLEFLAEPLGMAASERRPLQGRKFWKKARDCFSILATDTRWTFLKSVLTNLSRKRRERKSDKHDENRRQKKRNFFHFHPRWPWRTA